MLEKQLQNGQNPSHQVTYHYDQQKRKNPVNSAEFQHINSDSFDMPQVQQITQQQWDQEMN